MKFIKRSFIFGASPEIIRRASVLRKDTTEAEDALWEKINRNQLYGVRFKRQHPISKFIVDFYCAKAKLVIEVDGEIHNKTEIRERDEGREYELKNLGLKILRFTNDEVLNSIDTVMTAIRKTLTTPY